MHHKGWDHGLEVTDDGAGLVGHGGGVLLQKLADQCGLTAALQGALARATTFPQRGTVRGTTNSVPSIAGAAAPDPASKGRASARLNHGRWRWPPNSPGSRPGHGHEQANDFWPLY